MSRTRRRPKMPRCPGCGRGHIPYVGDHNKRKGRRISECPILQYPHQENDRFLKFREQHSLPLTEED